jgi:apolipoprotein N-acyltransferase
LQAIQDSRICFGLRTTYAIACKQASTFRSLVSSADSASSLDPYAPRPSFLERHGDRAAVLAVFTLTVVLTVLAFPPFHMPECACALAIPGAFWAYTRPRLKVFAWTMLAAQAVAWTILLGWLHHVTWLGLLLLGPFVGAWVGVWYLAAWWTLPKMLGRPTLIRLAIMVGLAAVWVVIEWTRTWLLGGFPWLPLAASQWERVAMLQIAAYTGASGVSFVLVMVNLGFAAYAHRLFREGRSGLAKRSQEFFLALFVVLACFSIHVQETFGRGKYTLPLARVAFVQPDIPQEVKWNPAEKEGILDVLEKITLTAAATKPDLILWPEAVMPLALGENADIKVFVESMAKRAHAPLLIGSLGMENVGRPDEHWFNGAYLVTPDGGVQPDHYIKRQLVPFGEYVPLRPVLGWLKKVVPIGDDDPIRGTDASPLLVPVNGRQVVFGPLICYEDTFPELAASSVRSGASVLAVVTNNGWFGEGGAAYQHAAHAVLRAVETRRPVLRCGNAGWSGWIDEFGSIRATLTDDRGSIYYRGTKTISVTRDIRWKDQRSFYVEHGDWFVLVCAAWVLLAYGLLVTAPPPKVEPAA